MTAAQILERLVAQKQFAWQSPLLGEIRRRLERLERLEEERLEWRKTELANKTTASL